MLATDQLAINDVVRDPDGDPKRVSRRGRFSWTGYRRPSFPNETPWVKWCRVWWSYRCRSDETAAIPPPGGRIGRQVPPVNWHALDSEDADRRRTSRYRVGDARGLPASHVRREERSRARRAAHDRPRSVLLSTSAAQPRGCPVGASVGERSYRTLRV